MIGIVCALKCEADRLISHFSLKPYLQKSPYSLYCNESICLVVSGIGKTQAAAATAYTHAVTGCSAWLNVGVGGHRDAPVGEGFFAHQVCDFESGRRYYPVFGWKLVEKTASVLTVDRVEKSYDREAVYEMEAAGFCAAAFCFSTSELIHSYKIVADNLEKPPTRDRSFIRSLIEAHLTAVESAVEKLLALENDLSDPTIDLTPFLERWHFTETQRHQLRGLLMRWEACYPQKSVWENSLDLCRKGKDVIRSLEACFS
ncbi:MAG: hypothetical protein JJU12_08370 [Chlamydiales bacterium]|nr:hypothetical protein [Chlamydiales bacterium]